MSGESNRLYGNRRCASEYWLKFANGRPVRCEDREGHSGSHFHLFAMRRWDDEPTPAPTRDRLDWARQP